MEEKEREQLKERLLKMVVNEPRLESMPPMTMAEVMVNSMSKPNLEPLLDFISQEIEKAREEGVKDGMRGMIDILCEKGCGSMFAVIEEKDVNKKIEELSKLKTNHMKIKTHKNQIKKMIEEILLEETGNVPSRAVVRICELFEDFETADIEMITLSRRAYQRKLEESKQVGIVMGKQEVRSGLDSGQLMEILEEMRNRGTSFLDAVLKINK